MSAFTKFYFRPGDNELIETVVHLMPETKSSIHGYVKDNDEKAISEALVMLFLASDEKPQSLFSQTFTDDEGHFMFGPLTTNQLYLIKVYKDSSKLRELQIVPE